MMTLNTEHQKEFFTN